MFDIGFSELVLIGLVALVVVGPKRLPVATRTIGALLGRAQRYVNDVKSDIQRQVDLEELRKVQAQVQNVGEQIQSSMQSVEKEVTGVTSSITSATNDVWEGFDDDLKEPQASGGSYRGGGYISAPEPSWTEQNEQRRIRSKVRNRLRKRFHTKRPRDE